MCGVTVRVGTRYLVADLLVLKVEVTTGNLSWEGSK